MIPPQPCSTCGAHGVKDLGIRGYCGLHLAQLYARFAPETFDGIGVGIPADNAELDQHLETLLTCNVCEATWYGRPVTDCTWCLDAVARMVEWQADLTLTRPDIDAADERYTAAMEGWADRLEVAVEAGIVSPSQAEQAWGRAWRRAA